MKVTGSNLYEVPEESTAQVHRAEYGLAGRVCGFSTV